MLSWPIFEESISATFYDVIKHLTIKFTPRLHDPLTARRDWHAASPCNTLSPAEKRQTYPPESVF